METWSLINVLRVNQIGRSVYRLRMYWSLGNMGARCSIALYNNGFPDTRVCGNKGRRAVRDYGTACVSMAPLSDTHYNSRECGMWLDEYRCTRSRVDSEILDQMRTQTETCSWQDWSFTHTHTKVWPLQTHPQSHPRPHNVLQSECLKGNPV